MRWESSSSRRLYWSRCFVSTLIQRLTKDKARWCNSISLHGSSSVSSEKLGIALMFCERGRQKSGGFGVGHFHNAKDCYLIVYRALGT
jgi:hypothetical protein